MTPDLDALVKRLEAAEKRCSVDAYAASGGSLTRFHFLELAVLLRDAITALRGSGWQPMETAPKDGTEILVHNKPGVRCIAWWGAYDDHWTDGNQRRCPHGWMPLPPAPKGDVE